MKIPQGRSTSRTALYVTMVALYFDCQRVLADTDTYNYTAGHELCPCLLPHQLESIDEDLYSDTVMEAFGANISTDVLFSFGIGCGQHDQQTVACSSAECSSEANMLPKTLNCELDYCELSFCYVDPDNCHLLHRRSDIFPNSHRYFSYATCWDVDSFTNNRRIASLENRIFKVGFNHNSGGWQGAYSDAGQQFLGPASQWSGPTVDFAVAGAERGGYRLNLTVPPDFLVNKSSDYFGSASVFDLCVYATSLGFLDFCLAQYTITDQRAATTDWLVLESQDINLIVQYQIKTSGWDRFSEQVRTIFLPFTDQVWIFMIFFVIPALGMLMVVHEYDHPGSAYPRNENIIVRDNKRPRAIEEVENRKVPLWRHFSRAVYINALSVLQQNYVHTVVTPGAMLNLLGISFFILTIIAVYTANLAAILTQKAQDTTISGLSDALNNNYRFCSERKNLERVQVLYPEVSDNLIVVDPEEEGGDGNPGFNCADCAPRIRVFDFLDQQRAGSDPRYCHAAFAPLEDLEVEQSWGRHCNKTIVGSRVGSIQTGIPINERVGPELLSWFLVLKNDGIFDRLLVTENPNPQCPDFDAGGEEGESLNIAQLTGIWVVSFGFAIAGLLVTCLRPQVEARQERTFKLVHQYDQMGNRINVLDKDTAWMDQQSVMKGTKRIFIGESRWGEVGMKLGGKSTTAFDVMSKRIGGSRNLNESGVLDHLDDSTELRELRRARSLEDMSSVAQNPQDTFFKAKSLGSLATTTTENTPQDLRRKFSLQRNIRPSENLGSCSTALSSSLYLDSLQEEESSDFQSTELEHEQHEPAPEPEPRPSISFRSDDSEHLYDEGAEEYA
eukprot:Nitzschia sp. Nitz4//scaffold207_size38617//25338//27925//NITZ4_007680-RA/size38617-augustus-gene-0.12-mRNA-1//-1//CDS//3329541620//5845//frame0